MRYLTIFACLLLLVCASERTTVNEAVQVDRRVVTRGFDFTEYTEEGFLITPKTYRGDYRSVGLLEGTIYPAGSRDASGTKQGGFEYGPWEYEDIDPKTAVDSLYSLAKSMGADAITDFVVEDIRSPVKDRPAVRASGFAINREQGE